MYELRNEKTESNPPIYRVKHPRMEQLVHLEVMLLTCEEAL